MIPLVLALLLACLAGALLALGARAEARTPPRHMTPRRRGKSPGPRT